MNRTGAPGSGSPPPVTGLFVAAVAFGALVFLTPLVAYVLREPLADGGLIGLLALFGVAAVLLLLSVGCLMLFLRAHAQATVPPDHRDLESQATADERLLMRAFGFDPADLRANRTQTLSERQRTNLRAGRAAMIAMGVTMLGVTYLSLACLPVVFGAAGMWTPLWSRERTGVWIGVGIINLLVGGSFVYTYRLLRHQLHQRVSVTEGIAGEPGHAGDGHPASRRVPSVVIGDVAVPVLNREQVAALRPGRRYRVCYVRAPIALIQSIDPR